MKWLILILLIILPIVLSSTTFFENPNEFFIMSTLPPSIIIVEKPVGAGASGSEGARGGGCDVFADKYKVCFHINESGECSMGCKKGYFCNSKYRCERLIIGKKIPSLFPIGLVFIILFSIFFYLYLKKKEQKKEPKEE